MAYGSSNLPPGHTCLRRCGIGGLGRRRDQGGGREGGRPGSGAGIGGFTRERKGPLDFILEIGNRGKRSVAIDIKSETGGYFGRLLATADVLLTNWLPARWNGPG